MTCPKCIKGKIGNMFCPYCAGSQMISDIKRLELVDKIINNDSGLKSMYERELSRG